MSCKVGDTLGSYTLLCECGQGAYGSVFLAENTFTKRRVALKIICSQGRSCERELNGLIQYQTVCPRTNLLQIYHVEKGDDCFWYTMDAADNLSAEEGKYIPDTLANRLREQRRLPTDAVRRMADELIANLETLHRRGLLHRDLKPDNILWIDGSATLGDIGLVTDAANVSLVGTPGFLPPEVLAGIREYRQADDYYSLGKVIYCALTGMPVEKISRISGLAHPVRRRGYDPALQQSLLRIRPGNGVPSPVSAQKKQMPHLRRASFSVSCGRTFRRNLFPPQTGSADSVAAGSANRSADGSADGSAADEEKAHSTL